MKLFFLGLMSFFYIGAGLNHFIDPGFYLPMMPPYIPAHRLMILVSGVVEVACGIFLIPKRTRSLAAWTIIAMLISFFSVHIYMLQFRGSLFVDVPEVILWARIPLQFVFIYWAYVYTEKSRR